ncbi:MAG: transcriptional repressor LexA [Coriobacteriales bacterium]|jgi:repressor LexA
MDAPKLTDRQKQILDFIRISIRDKGFPPSVREIGDATGLKSSSSVHSHLTALEKKGYLKRDASSARALTVNEDLLDDELSVRVDDVVVDEPIDEVYRNVVPLPLVGRVAAGSPILAEQNIEETLGLPKQIVGDANSFLLTVSGESMIEAGILDGDIVVVTEQSTARNGEIVVAMIDDEATVKTFYKEDGRIRLQPENSTMDPIYTTDAVILGKVTALFRSL